MGVQCAERPTGSGHCWKIGWESDHPQRWAQITLKSEQLILTPNSKFSGLANIFLVNLYDYALVVF